MVSDRIFGRTGAPCREVTDFSKTRPGDILVKINPNGTVSHVGIVLQYVPAGMPLPNGGVGSQDKFITCDGNLGALYGEVGKVTWGLPNTVFTNSNYHVLTRYPN
jgi:hypothetical protein